MLFIPLPFVAALLLLVLLAQMSLREPTANRSFRSLVILLAALSVLIGIRWGYSTERLLPVQALFASAVGPLAWIGFAAFVSRQESQNVRRLWPHALPTALIGVLAIARPQWLDVTLIVIFAWYAVLLARLAWRGSDALDLARIEEAPLVHRALQAMAATLLLAAIADSLISVSIRWFEGAFAAIIVSAATVPLILLLGIGAAIASRNTTPPEKGETPRLVPDSDSAVVATLIALIEEQQLYRDHNLTLQRLARKAGIPARLLSQAVNGVCGRNLSQFINDFRVAEACRLLENADIPITTLTYDAGFLTKSNFNREFRRVTGVSPTEWRARRASRQEPTLKFARRSL